jgi:hypothetical protein
MEWGIKFMIALEMIFYALPTLLLIAVIIKFVYKTIKDKL